MHKALLAVLKDDLSASTASVMDLLAKLFTFQSVLDYMVQSTDEKYDLRIINTLWVGFSWIC